MCTHSDLLGFTKSSRCSTHAFPYSPTSAPSPRSFHLQVQASLVGTKFCLNQNQQIFRPEAGAILLPSLKLSILPTCPSLSVPGELHLMDHYPGYLATYLYSPESLSSLGCFFSMISDRQLALILVLDENLNLWTLAAGFEPHDFAMVWNPDQWSCSGASPIPTHFYCTYNSLDLGYL